MRLHCEKPHPRVNSPAYVGVLAAGRGQVPGQLRKANAQHRYDWKCDEIRQGSNDTSLRCCELNGEQQGNRRSHVGEALHQ